MPRHPNNDGWSGQNVTAARRYIHALLPLPCGHCGQTVYRDDAFNVGHKEPRWKRPDLSLDPANWRAEHKKCSDSSGVANIIAKAKHEARQETPRQRRFLREGASSGYRRTSAITPPNVTPVPLFDPKTMAGIPWLADLMDIPSNASWPSAMSPPHPEAVGSHGYEAEAWLRAEYGLELRWWQRLAFRRQLEHDADGDLVWRYVVESTPRRCGKSVRLRAMALWRMAHAEEFGEQQLILHTGKDLPICKEIHRQAWRWAEEQGWIVRRQNGNEEIERLDGSRWMVRGRSSVYGYDVTLGMIDEAWAVDPGVVDDGMEPAMLGRVQPQLLLTSTAHRRATSLMKRRMESALAGLGEDFRSLLMWWGAPRGSDVGDPDVWRAASPFWSSDTELHIRDRWERAMRGETEIAADDPDPIEGFKAQYLNIWPLAHQPRPEPGEPVFTVGEWERLVMDPAGLGAPRVVAVEGWFQQGACVASAWRVGDRVLVSVQEFPTVVEAAAGCAGLAVSADRVLVGKSLLSTPAFGGLLTEPVGDTTRQTVTALRRLADDDVLRHDGGRVLSEQVSLLRVSPGAEGVRLRSTSRADAVKAAAWAADAAWSVVEAPAIW